MKSNPKFQVLDNQGNVIKSFSGVHAHVEADRYFHEHDEAEEIMRVRRKKHIYPVKRGKLAANPHRRGISYKGYLIEREGKIDSPSAIWRISYQGKLSSMFFDSLKQAKLFIDKKKLKYKHSELLHHTYDQLASGSRYKRRRRKVDPVTAKSIKKMLEMKNPVPGMTLQKMTVTREEAKKELEGYRRQGFTGKIVKRSYADKPGYAGYAVYVGGFGSRYKKMKRAVSDRRQSARDHAHMLGYMDASDIEAGGGLKEKKRQIKGNPHGTVIYDRILGIQAQKGSSSNFPKEKFEHKFSSDAQILGMPDGSLRVVSKSGKKLWKKFNYSKEDLKK